MIRNNFGAFLFVLVAVTVTQAAGEAHHLCAAQPRIIESTPKSHWGYIASPNHPKSYPAESMQCTFKLQPKPDEQIQLTFSYFNLRESDKLPATQSCDLSDSVKIAVNTNSRSLTDQGTLVGEYCGRKQPDIVMSVGRPLTAQFTVRAKENPNISAVYMFKAKYTFLKDYGIKTTAQQNQTAGCHFTFDGRRMPSTGTFESPNFGGLYPFSTSCIYTFRLFNNQTLRLRFNHFEVDGQQGCRRPNDDTVQIKEGEYDWKEFILPAEEDPAKQQPNRALYCGLKSPTEFNSKSNVVNVIFKSGQWFAKTGFQGAYTFFGHPGVYLPASSTRNGHGWILLTSFLISVLTCWSIKRGQQ